MRRITILFLIILITLLLLPHKSDTVKKNGVTAKAPNDWFHRQRAFPYDDINYSHYNSALTASQSPRLRKSSLTNNWIQSGPLNTGGRITDVEGVPEDDNIIYIATAQGGIFKSTDGGDYWRPIFDETNTLSIGDIATDPKNSNILYAGTGEVNGGGGSVTYGGNGLYKSTDAGETWQNIGLAETRFIGRVVVDPVNSNVIYVAATGTLFSTSTERGLYKSTDGGNSWTKILYVSDKTGCVDVAVNPGNPNIILAAMWERIRNFDSYSYSGVNSAIYRSTDAGLTWNKVSQGLPTGDIGRIGLDISKSNSNIAFASFTKSDGRLEGIYKSTDTGLTWTATNTPNIQSIFATYGWWFSNIRIDPRNPEKVFILGLQVAVTLNGGLSWGYCGTDMHVDHHGMYIHPENSNLIFEGNDGGFYISHDGGESWEIKNSIPITQFYTCEVDNSAPNRLYGGTQDNGVIRTKSGSLNDWSSIIWGDGFNVLVDPNDNRYVYAESQYGNLSRSTDGGTTFLYALNGITDAMKNWNTPFVFDPSNSATLYYGGQKVYKSTDRGESWTAISPYIAENIETNAFSFGTITTLAVSNDGMYVYAGSDDGNVWVGKNRGTEWRKTLTNVLPTRWITRIAVDPENSTIIYITLSGFRYDSYQPHVFKVSDLSEESEYIEDISGNLPEAPVNDIIVDNLNPKRLYLATDVGVFTSSTGGNNWEHLSNTLPMVPINDICLHKNTRTLIAATYGRSMYKIDLSFISAVENEPLPKEYYLSQNYPNPFNPATIISYNLRKSCEVELKVHDISGKEILVLEKGFKHSGNHKVTFNANSLPSGVYIYSLRAGEIFNARKMVLMK